jgi:O-succinylbenzoate synthase
LNFGQAKEVIDALKDRIRLRIDVNRKWSFKESLQFFSAYTFEDFDYIEEPMDQIEKLMDFPYPFALDETLQENQVESYVRLPHCSALVIKPTMIGGISAIKKYQRFGKPLILSPCYESGVGIFHIAAIAKRLQLLDTHIGIDTYGFLKEDILNFPLQINGSKLTLPQSLMHALSHCETGR